MRFKIHRPCLAFHREYKIEGFASSWTTSRLSMTHVFGDILVNLSHRSLDDSHEHSSWATQGMCPLPHNPTIDNPAAIRQGGKGRRVYRGLDFVYALVQVAEQTRRRNVDRQVCRPMCSPLKTLPQTRNQLGRPLGVLGCDFPTSLGSIRSRSCQWRDPTSTSEQHSCEGVILTWCAILSLCMYTAAWYKIWGILKSWDKINVPRAFATPY